MRLTDHRQVRREALAPLLKDRPFELILEPGRFIVGNAGVLLTEVITVKRSGERVFAICDAGMNDLLRPSLYDSFHRIVPIEPGEGEPLLTDVVGPICESGDTFCKNRMLPKFKEGDHLAMLSAGAYGFVMASNYNTRAFPAEILVKGNRSEVVRKRQSLKQLWASESVPKWLK